MSYPKTSEQRLLQLYGFTKEDLDKLYKECNEDIELYKERIEAIDLSLAAGCMAMIMDEKTFLH